ncbi:MAG TPA: tRNA (adenosine(37)-N6)-dimethylallyltransferase MiaA [Fimbriimonadaceae bacterium]|nr:tRNA (adenosine(37)-N6)-dimethylallyltransferase MiaA [Fimbriimonadaceae bacterium]
MGAPLLLAIMGPTASGKTSLAERVAEAIDATLVNADAFQIYRGLDIGTSKPTRRERYELLDIREPDESFGLGEWLRLALDVLTESFEGARNVVVVGGTGLYVRALFEEYASISGPPDPDLRRRLNETPIEELRQRLADEHPELASTVELSNPVRVRRALERMQSTPPEPIHVPGFLKLKLGLSPPPEGVSARIEHRAAEMVQNGWVQEVMRLRESNFRREDPGLRAIGYRALWDHIERKISLDEALGRTVVETRRYAKRQRTWLRSEPNLHELSATTENEAFDSAMERIGSVFDVRGISDGQGD